MIFLLLLFMWLEDGEEAVLCFKFKVEFIVFEYKLLCKYEVLNMCYLIFFLME